ncbi:MAG: hypothetical protein M0011_07685 [Elusimicrobia bacterium]|nr:hypothetical protein [Elusimicrobiota bacterium]
MKKNFPLLFPTLLLACSSNAFAWGSLGILGPSTHTRIAAKALKLLDSGSYPDMMNNGTQIKNGATSEAGHEKIHNGGGRLKDWWDGGDGRGTLKGGVLPSYSKLEIEDAYLNLGRMCHLTEDQAVPAHAAHIPHSIVLHLPPDGVEKYTGKHHDFGEIPQVAGDKMPYEYYQTLQDETRSHLGEWVSPVTGKPFWDESPEAYRFKDATLGPVGQYGGGGDTFLQSAEQDLKASGLSAREIAARQLGMAAGYTKAVLESASKRLPPLVSGLSVYPGVITPGQKVQIAFTALENRTPHVRYAVTLRPDGGEETVILTGETKLDKPSPSFDTSGQQEPKKPEELLFNRRVRLDWAAAAGGKPLAEGAYLLEVHLMDDDGNIIPVSVNSDDVRENDSARLVSVVNTAPKDPSPFSFD